MLTLLLDCKVLEEGSKYAGVQEVAQLLVK